MTGLLADGWFYISSAGLLVSGVLFFFLLGQYRAASEAADQPEAEVPVETAAPEVRPVWSGVESSSSEKLASIPSADQTQETPVLPARAAAPKAAEPKPSESSASAAPEKRRDPGFAAVSPAVVYLQNIKAQLDELQDETRGLAKRVAAITDRDEAMIERLGELAQAVAELKARPAAAPAVVVPAPAPVEPPAPKRAKKIEPAASVSVPVPAPTPAPAPVSVPEPEPVHAIELVAAVRPEPKSEAKPAPEKTLSPEDTARFELDAVIESQLAKVTGRAPEKRAPAAEPAPAPVPVEAEPEPGEKPRRGPVWPV